MQTLTKTIYLMLLYRIYLLQQAVPCVVLLCTNQKCLVFCAFVCLKLDDILTHDVIL